MKIILVLLMTIAGARAEVIDLGIIDEAHGFTWDRPTNRVDVVAFKLTFIPAKPATNLVLITTNDVITIEDLKTLPDGRILMVLQCLRAHNLQTLAKQVYRFDLYKSDPEPPLVRPLGIIRDKAMPTNDVMETILRETAKLMVAPPPIPEQVPSRSKPQGAMPEPLPGTGEAYAEAREKMLHFFANGGAKGRKGPHR